MARAIDLKHTRAAEIGRLAVGWGWYVWKVEAHGHITLIRWPKRHGWPKRHDYQLLTLSSLTTNEEADELLGKLLECDEMPFRQARREVAHSYGVWMG